MTLATVRFHCAGQPHTASLTDEGWSIDGDAAPLSSILDQLASLSRYGPADGDPAAAARILGGTVTDVRAPSPVPAGTVY
jgi:hypothetical protein